MATFSVSIGFAESLKHLIVTLQYLI